MEQGKVNLPLSFRWRFEAPNLSSMHKSARHGLHPSYDTRKG